MSYSYIVYVTDLYLQSSYKLQKVSINKSFIHSFIHINTDLCESADVFSDPMGT